MAISGRLESAGAFAAFALLHAPCGEAVIETRLDEGLVACWCLRCNELRYFGTPATSGRKPRSEAAASA